MNVPTALPSDTDLNTVTTPGLYYCDGAVGANKADSANAFSLLVESTGAWGNQGRKQTYTAYDTGKTYVRVITGNVGDVWTDWMPYATATPPQKYSLPLAEGWVRVNSAEYWRTQEGLVVVVFRVAREDKQSLSPGNHQVATLPAGFRPVGYYPNGVSKIFGGTTGNVWIDEAGAIWENNAETIPESSGDDPSLWKGVSATVVFVAG